MSCSASLCSAALYPDKLLASLRCRTAKLSVHTEMATPATATELYPVSDQSQRHTDSIMRKVVEPCGRVAGVDKQNVTNMPSCRCSMLEIPQCGSKHKSFIVVFIIQQYGSAMTDAGADSSVHTHID